MVTLFTVTIQEKKNNILSGYENRAWCMLALFSINHSLFKKKLKARILIGPNMNGLILRIESYTFWTMILKTNIILK